MSLIKMGLETIFVVKEFAAIFAIWVLEDEIAIFICVSMIDMFSQLIVCVENLF